MSGASSHRDRRAAGIDVCIARVEHRVHAASIAAAIGAEVDRGAAGIARRSPEWIEARIDEGTALIAASGDSWAGFCAVRPWEGGKFVSTSALIVRPERRGEGLARRLKIAALALSRRRFPEAIPFGLTTSAAVAAIRAYPKTPSWIRPAARPPFGVGPPRLITPFIRHRRPSLPGGLSLGLGPTDGVSG